MRVTTSDTITEPAVLLERATDAVLVIAAGLLSQEVISHLDKLLSGY